MKILVVGRTGQIGAELCQLLAREHIPYVAPTRQELDIMQAETIESVLEKHRPTIVINTAGYRSSGKAEIEPSLCFGLNRDAVAYLAKACNERRIIFLQVSSWRVFTGDSRQAYTEEDTPMPLDVLGSSFWQGEQQIREICPRHIILRLSWVVSFRSRNRLTIYLDCMRQHKQLPAYTERYGNPTTAWDVAQAIVAICRQVSCDANVWGTYHYSADGVVSETFLAEAIRAEAGKLDDSCNWLAIYPDNKVDSKRKRYACLSNHRLRDTFGIHSRPWRESLSSLVQTHLNHLPYTGG